MFDETDKYRVISHQLGSSLTDKYQFVNFQRFSTPYPEVA